MNDDALRLRGQIVRPFLPAQPAPQRELVAEVLGKRLGLAEADYADEFCAWMRERGLKLVKEEESGE